MIDLNSLSYEELQGLREDLDREFKYRKYEQKRNKAVKDLIAASQKLFEEFPEVRLEIADTKIEISKYFPLVEGDFYVAE